MNPPELRYSKEHEWVRTQPDGMVVVGITGFAAESLGDVVFVELPEIGVEVVQGEKMGEIESVKAVSDLYSPVSGSIMERNERLIDNPELVNDSPFDTGWMLKVSIGDVAQLDSLLTADVYEAFLASEEN